MARQLMRLLCQPVSHHRVTPATTVRGARRAQDYDRFCQIRRSVGFDEVVHYGTGLVLLFHGESGTGKTMTANALANHLHKRLLVVRGIGACRHCTGCGGCIVHTLSLPVPTRRPTRWVRGADAVVLWCAADHAVDGGATGRRHVQVHLSRSQDSGCVCAWAVPPVSRHSASAGRALPRSVTKVCACACVRVRGAVAMCVQTRSCSSTSVRACSNHGAEAVVPWWPPCSPKSSALKAC